MRFTLSWLKEYLETDASLEAITDKLTSLGLVVDKVENKAEALAPFTICEIVEAEKHPSADRLKVCRVNTGSEILQIVCGAPNARAGLKAVLAHPGDIIPSTQQVLKVGKVRDVESFGMMCSADELLLGGDAEGIIEVDERAPVGESYVKWMGMDDILIDIEVSPNRSDCLGVYGIARDLAATGLGTLKPLKEHKVKGSYLCPINVGMDSYSSTPPAPFDPSTSLFLALSQAQGSGHLRSGRTEEESFLHTVRPERSCAAAKSKDEWKKEDKDNLYFTGRVIRGLKNGPSPEWLQKKLQAIGLHPISALVDITNYFAYDRARPLHVFDASKIKGNLSVRLSKGGETFKALDGKDYILPEAVTVITDDSGVISLAGVMGGESTGCDEHTHTVFLEAAFFDPIAIAMVGRSLGIISDSRFRFERGVDPASTLPGLEAATQMILDLCGGEASEVVEVGHAPDFRTHISFNPVRLETLGGATVSQERITTILTDLGFEVKETGKHLSVHTPSWRFGMEHEADLVEEILRVEGYDNIPAVPYGERPQEQPLDVHQKRRFMARDRLANRGLMEVITWSFISQKDAEPFGGVPENLVLLNPLTQEMDRMRPSILPNLFKAVLSNQNRGAEAVALFEVGPQYSDPTPKGQHMMASGVRAGAFKGGDWLEKRRLVDLYDAKGDVMALVEIGNLTPQVEPGAPSWYHPGRSGTLKLGPLVLGYFGEIHPRLLKVLDLKGPVVAFEIFLDRMPLPKRKTTAKPLLVLSPFQGVDRDFAFVVDHNVPAESLLKAAKKADPVLIEDCTLFDVFELPEGQKSLGLRVRLQPKDRTLTDEEIQTLSEKIISSIAQNTGGVLRQ